VPLELRVTLAEDEHGPLAIFSFPLRPRRPDRLSPLTPAEEQVLRQLLEGSAPTAIARRRRVSLATVRKQVESVYRKLGVHSQSELAALLGG
jgi:DNA-binding NarL/FixJ family response regulator